MNRYIRWQAVLSDSAYIFGLHGIFYSECHRTSASLGGWQSIWLLIVSYSADLSCYQLMAKSHVCFYMRLISIFVIKSLISATFGSGPRGHENFHDDMNMSAIITWSMEFIATIIFFTYDQRHFIAMIQNILPWTTVFHSYDHHFHTWSGVIHSHEYWFIAWRVMISDDEQLLFMRFIYENEDHNAMITNQGNIYHIMETSSIRLTPKMRGIWLANSSPTHSTGPKLLY